MPDRRDDGVILVIDDDQTNIKVIIGILKPAGLTVISARNGEMGIKRALFVLPDLILLDVMMPGIDGFETCHLLKSEPATQAIPVIFITAIDDEDSKVKAFDAGGVDYITKPSGQREVLARVKTHLSLKRKQELLERLGEIDGLTEIPNRRQFDRVLKGEWRRSQRRETSSALIMIDIDYFKNFNDSYGHVSGDQCRRTVAQTLASSVQRAADFVARYGGEEFAVILPETNFDSATAIAEQIRQNVASLHLPHVISQVSDYVTLSLAVATVIPNDETSANNLIEMADRALYRAKSNGRNQVRSSTDRDL
ncbi:GGDEF domain-containing response regulator [Planktothricoides raciborskii]|uniref:Diguanylate cyclase n=1 Tax=Planktothricoides raciborskii FACHB-1370 TaxID=2949576 RepID=A0ABR8EL93_9CYAN|nr:diguanylate cyclase [Planktothricoides raciborskii]MBD2547654.1 diguanylate cyclase [Planktothricoides raciborskii FACHB-1370]MBD2586093.1 diguanylate cyclase [Planktothricoides raciborskii FACHB-1261]